MKGFALGLKRRCIFFFWKSKMAYVAPGSEEEFGSIPARGAAEAFKT